jgi:hypothetical protein
MIANWEAQELIGRWWFAYDQGLFDELNSLVTEDVHFTVRTDTGKTDYEPFVNADVVGKSDVITWQTEHRLDSPTPLRHNGANLHLTGTIGEDALFRSYIFVTQIVEGTVCNLSTAVVTGSVRRSHGDLRISSLHVVLDTARSRTLREVFSWEPHLSTQLIFEPDGRSLAPGRRWHA